MRKMVKKLEVDDLVWAKMKGYPHWPGKIISPPSSRSKAKKYHHYVLFFGTNNCAWIGNENIELHSEKSLDDYGNKKTSFTFLSAVETIVKNSKGVSKYQKSNTSSKKTFEKQNNNLEKNVSKDGKLKKKDHPSTYPPAKKQKILSTSSDLSDQIKPNFSANSFCENVVKPSTSRNFKNEKLAQLMSNVPNIGHQCSTKPLSNIHQGKYFERPDTPPIDLKCKNEILQDKKIKPTTKRIGFLGLDNMAQGIVKNLCQSRHSVIIWNPTPSECQMFAEEFNNVQIAATPADVIEAADITFSCVSDSEVVKQIVFGNLCALKQLGRNIKKKGYIEMTSMSPEESKTIGFEIKNKGGRYLEAPLSGSRRDAINGTLTILAAGDEALYKDSKSCFDAMSKSHKLLNSDLGSAYHFSLIYNMLQATVYASLAECLVFLKKLGYEDNLVFDILEDDILNSKAIVDKATSMKQNNYVCNSTLKHVQEDLNIGLKLGDKVSHCAPVSSVVNEIFKRCRAMRYGDHDISAVFEATKY